jgi:ABC-2 type transport system permease protein
MPIFDQGYQHWTGELAGHSWRWLTITRHGVRVGRKSIIVRLLLLLAWLPALALAAVLSIWGLVEQKSSLVQPLVSIFSFLGPDFLNNPKSFRLEVWTLSYSSFLYTELLFSMVLIVVVGPSLISRDIRFNALPLYFSRPLRRIDYFLGKLGVIGAFLAMIMVVPSIVAYVLGLLFSLDLSIITDTFPLLLACVGFGLITTLSAGLFILALSSLSRSSIYIGLFWVGVWFITAIVATALESVDREQRMRERHRKIWDAQNAAMQHHPHMTFAEQQRFQEAQAKMFDDIAKQEIEDAKSDWRPTVSYVGNLDRLRVALLGTNSCWERLSMTRPERERVHLLRATVGSQYPWQWSAAVLSVLFGASAWILNVRVKSLDRLK